MLIQVGRITTSRHAGRDTGNAAPSRRHSHVAHRGHTALGVDHDLRHGSRRAIGARRHPRVGQRQRTGRVRRAVEGHRPSTVARGTDVARGLQLGCRAGVAFERTIEGRGGHRREGRRVGRAQELVGVHRIGENTVWNVRDAVPAGCQGQAACGRHTTFGVNRELGQRRGRAIGARRHARVGQCQRPSRVGRTIEGHRPRRVARRADEPGRLELRGRRRIPRQVARERGSRDRSERHRIDGAQVLIEVVGIDAGIGQDHPSPGRRAPLVQLAGALDQASLAIMQGVGSDGVQHGQRGDRSTPKQRHVGAVVGHHLVVGHPEGKVIALRTLPRSDLRASGLVGVVQPVGDHCDGHRIGSGAAHNAPRTAGLAAVVPGAVAQQSPVAVGLGRARRVGNDAATSGCQAGRLHGRNFD